MKQMYITEYFINDFNYNKIFIYDSTIIKKNLFIQPINVKYKIDNTLNFIFTKLNNNYFSQEQNSSDQQKQYGINIYFNENNKNIYIYIKPIQNIQFIDSTNIVISVNIEQYGAERTRVGYTPSTTPNSPAQEPINTEKDKGTSEDSDTTSTTIPPEDVDINPDDFKRPNPMQNVLFTTLDPDEYYNVFSTTDLIYTNKKSFCQKILNFFTS